MTFKQLKQRLNQFWRKIMLADDEFLCDTCKYDYGDVCRRPERPNARECDDYQRLRR